MKIWLIAHLGNIITAVAQRITGIDTLLKAVLQRVLSVCN
jgi:hypothetical protein